MWIRKIPIYIRRDFEKDLDITVKKAIKEFIRRVNGSLMSDIEKKKNIKMAKSKSWQNEVKRDARRYFNMFGELDGYSI